MCVLRGFVFLVEQAIPKAAGVLVLALRGSRALSCLLFVTIGSGYLRAFLGGYAVNNKISEHFISCAAFVLAMLFKGLGLFFSDLAP